jgi:hypothetical protein
MMLRLGLVACMVIIIQISGPYPACAHDAPHESEARGEELLALPGDIPFMQSQTDGNAVGLVISNYGFFGNNFVTRNPSMEYPLGSQQEHLIRAGLWVGGINANGDTVVSAGSISGLWGTSTASATEFTPTKKLTERSILITSRSYSKDAISEQDFIASCKDWPRRGTNDAVLRVSVKQEVYLWSYRFAEGFVIVSFTIKNEDEEGFITAPCLSIFAELSSGWKGGYDQWRPPSTMWFYKKILEYFPEHRMCGEHHHSFDNGNCPSWGAFAILGAHSSMGDSIADVNVSFNWWDWHFERENPFNDPIRYEMMKNGEIDSTQNIRPGDDDAVEMVSAGPFSLMAPGDSIVFVCAFLGGMDRASLLDNVEWAQRAYENDYILPSPPQPSRFRVRPGKGKISLFWDDYPEAQKDPFYGTLDFEGYRVYVTRTEGATTEEFDMVREVDLVNSIGYDTGLKSLKETNTINDTTYVYRLDIDNVKDGFKYWVALTAFDRGVPEEGVESMESGIRATRVLVIPGTPSAGGDTPVTVVPNPYRGAAVWDGARDREKYVWFVNLPQRATIRIYTLAGDLVKTINFDGRTYDGADVQGLRTAAERTIAISGGICAWDLISDQDQAVATGLYMYSVENMKTGSNQVGKLMVIR